MVNFIILYLAVGYAIKYLKNVIRMFYWNVDGMRSCKAVRLESDMSISVHSLINLESLLSYK